jgi:uncharacterized protein
MVWVRTCSSGSLAHWPPRGVVVRRARREQEILKRLDPRQPFVIDTRDLGRRPGSMRQVSRTVPAPANLGLDVIGVPEGADLELDLRLEAVMDGVLVSGTARAPLVGECVRCLERFESDLDSEFQELYAYPDTDADEGAPRLVGDLFDLEPVLRDAVVLALPLQPWCREDCPGLCAECGARLADHPDHRHEVADPRWAALQGLFGDQAAGERKSTTQTDAARVDENQEK